MKTHAKRFHILALLSLLVPAFGAYANVVKYHSLSALLNDFTAIDKCEGSCTDFIKALKDFVNSNPKYRSNRPSYENFIRQLEAKLATRNATLIGVFLLQGKGLFPEVEGLLKGRSKDDLIKIIAERLKKPTVSN